MKNITITQCGRKLDLRNIKGHECEAPITQLWKLVDALTSVVIRLMIAYVVTLVITVFVIIAMLIWG